jgi:ATP-binding cassette subfamily B protein
MKYILEALKKTKASLLLAAYIVIDTIIMACEVMELKMVAQVINAGTLDMFNRYIILVVISTICNGLHSFCKRYRYLIFNHLTLRLMEKLTTADYKLFVKYSPGTILKVVTDVESIYRLIDITIDIVKSIIYIVITLTFIASINPVVVIPVTIGIGIVGTISHHFIKKMNKVSDEVDNLRNVDHNLTDEIVNGFVEIRSYPKVAGELLRKSAGCRDALYETSCRKMNLNIFWNLYISGFCNIISCGLLLYLIMLKGQGGAFDNTMAMTLVMYVWQLMNPMINISSQVSDVSELYPKIHGYESIMEYENEIEDGNIKLESFNDSIAIKNLNFSYEDSSSVLKNINMTIKKGQRIGICGTSGCGKTTLLKLLNRFYDPTSGSIELDGIDIRSITNESRRSFIGTVHQKPYIFNGTIRENILFGMNRQVTETELIDACKKASIYEFIKKLPNGFETQVGPRGMKLSGGETQRIAIAKIFLLDPEIIILDEATSALDNETESVIQEAMELFENKTIIAVAHRLSTIEDYDVIYVFSNHSIEEFGTHKELMELGGIYASMHK